MYKNRQFKGILAILIMIMCILSLRLIFVNDKFNRSKNNEIVVVTKDKNLVEIEKYGYSEILELLKINSEFRVKSINMMEKEICNVQIDYVGDIKLLYTSLYSLNESKNFLGINSININKDDKITNISIDFKKNK